MNRYGQVITWSTVAAPHPFSGTLTNYGYRDVFSRLTDDDEAGDLRAIIQHSRKSALSFDAKVTEATTDLLDLSSGAAITVSGVTGGLILASRVVERWVLQQQKTVSVQATHYPDMTHTGTPVAAGTDLDAFTPDQSALSIVHPGGSLIFSTYGLSHAAGVVHELEISQELEITEDDPSPAGTIVGAASHGYKRSLRLMLLAKSTRPLPGSTLVLTGAPDHAADFLIESSDEVWAKQRGKMYEVSGIWIPPFSA